MRLLTAASLLLGGAFAAAGDGVRPLPPEEAGGHIGQKVTVEMLVRASLNGLAKHKEIYLDSTNDHRDPRNLAAVIPERAVGRFKRVGIEDPAGYYKGKTIRVTGTVTLKGKEPRIVVDEPRQIEIVRKKG